MAKKKSGTPRPTRAATKSSDRDSTNSGQVVEQSAHGFDHELLDWLNRRAVESVRTSADGTERTMIEILAEDEARIRAAVAANPGPLPGSVIQAVFREWLSGIRGLRQAVRVIYLGPEYSFSHLAAVQQFGQSAELVPVATIAAVFDAVHRRQADFGVVPIENSTDGRVTDTLDMFARMRVQICGDVQLRIHHCLLGRCKRTDIREVYSKPQALSQCRTWLARHLPDAVLLEASSTAVAARLAAEKPGAAAIASRQAGIQQGLDLIAENIEDNPHNVTRFAVIGDHVPARTGSDRTAVMFEVPHQPGSLADAMMIFKRRKLNLTWIESFPMPDTPSEYLFFVEFQGHASDANVKRGLADLGRQVVRVEVLGTYPSSTPVEDSLATK
jgi:chorismate mutase/prephenate dehydratase